MFYAPPGNIRIWFASTHPEKFPVLNLGGNFRIREYTPPATPDHVTFGKWRNMKEIWRYMKEYGENIMKEFVENMKKYVKNMKKYVENM